MCVYMFVSVSVRMYVYVYACRWCKFGSMQELIMIIKWTESEVMCTHLCVCVRGFCVTLK
jgi:hypothetical protein